jgi:3-isopropylmalate/(R)-2-methylmalate dehydratase small subunit
VRAVFAGRPELKFERRHRDDGKVFKYKDNIDTDVIIPGGIQYTDPLELASHCMEDIDKTFAKGSRRAIIVAGENTRLGSSREHAPVAIRRRCSCVSSKSFARIFLPKAINIGFPILECPEAVRRQRPPETN